MCRQLQQWCTTQTQLLTGWLTSRGAVRSARWRPAPAQHSSAVHALRSRPGTDHGPVDAYCNSLVLHLLLGSRSVRVPQQILNVERRSSRQRSQLRSRRFIVKHFHSADGFTPFIKNRIKSQMLQNHSRVCVSFPARSVSCSAWTIPTQPVSAESSTVKRSRHKSRLKETITPKERKKKPLSTVSLFRASLGGCDRLPSGSGDVVFRSAGEQSGDSVLSSGWRRAELHVEGTVPPIGYNCACTLWIYDAASSVCVCVCVCVCVFLSACCTTTRIICFRLKPTATHSICYYDNNIYIIIITINMLFFFSIRRL